jgi:DNA-binding CsgD family transcriptional regulator
VSTHRQPIASLRACKWPAFGTLGSQVQILTPGELRVLAAVGEVGGVPAVAEVAGISQATVKTHLQHLSAKTGTGGQIDLVRLVAPHASPLRQIP